MLNAYLATRKSVNYELYILQHWVIILTGQYISNEQNYAEQLLTYQKIEPFSKIFSFTALNHTSYYHFVIMICGSLPLTFAILIFCCS